MEIILRRATLEDCEAIYEVHVSSIRGLGGSHYSEADVEAWAAGKSPERYVDHIRERTMIVAEEGSELAGFGTFDESSGMLMQLYVRPEYAQKGVGSRILDALMEVARACGHREVGCDASLNAEAFYAKRGFQRERRYTRRLRVGKDLDCISMKKTLESAPPSV